LPGAAIQKFGGAIVRLDPDARFTYSQLQRKQDKLAGGAYGVVLMRNFPYLERKITNIGSTVNLPFLYFFRYMFFSPYTKDNAIALIRGQQQQRDRLQEQLMGKIGIKEGKVTKALAAQIADKTESLKSTSRDLEKSFAEKKAEFAQKISDARSIDPALAEELEAERNKYIDDYTKNLRSVERQRRYLARLSSGSKDAPVIPLNYEFIIDYRELFEGVGYMYPPNEQVVDTMFAEALAAGVGDVAGVVDLTAVSPSLADDTASSSEGAEEPRDNISQSDAKAALQRGPIFGAPESHSRVYKGTSVESMAAAGAYSPPSEARMRELLAAQSQRTSSLASRLERRGYGRSSMSYENQQKLSAEYAKITDPTEYPNNSDVWEAYSTKYPEQYEQGSTFGQSEDARAIIYNAFLVRNITDKSQYISIAQAISQISEKLIKKISQIDLYKYTRNYANQRAVVYDWLSKDKTFFILHIDPKMSLEHATTRLSRDGEPFNPLGMDMSYNDTADDYQDGQPTTHFTTTIGPSDLVSVAMAYRALYPKVEIKGQLDKASEYAQSGMTQQKVDSQYETLSGMSMSERAQQRVPSVGFVARFVYAPDPDKNVKYRSLSFTVGSPATEVGQGDDNNAGGSIKSKLSDDVETRTLERSLIEDLMARAYKHTVVPVHIEDTEQYKDEPLNMLADHVFTRQRNVLGGGGLSLRLQQRLYPQTEEDSEEMIDEETFESEGDLDDSTLQDDNSDDDIELLEEDEDVGPERSNRGRRSRRRRNQADDFDDDFVAGPVDDPLEAIQELSSIATGASSEIPEGPAEELADFGSDEFDSRWARNELWQGLQPPNENTPYNSRIDYEDFKHIYGEPRPDYIRLSNELSALSQDELPDAEDSAHYLAHTPLVAFTAKELQLFGIQLVWPHATRVYTLEEVVEKNVLGAYISEYVQNRLHDDVAQYVFDDLLRRFVALERRQFEQRIEAEDDVVPPFERVADYLGMLYGGLRYSENDALQEKYPELMDSEVNGVLEDVLSEQVALMLSMQPERLVGASPVEGFLHLTSKGVVANGTSEFTPVGELNLDGPAIITSSIQEGSSVPLTTRQKRALLETMPLVAGPEQQLTAQDEVLAALADVGQRVGVFVAEESARQWRKSNATSPYVRLAEDIYSQSSTPTQIPSAHMRDTGRVARFVSRGPEGQKIAKTYFAGTQEAVAEKNSGNLVEDTSPHLPKKLKQLAIALVRGAESDKIKLGTTVVMVRGKIFQFRRPLLESVRKSLTDIYNAFQEKKRNPPRGYRARYMTPTTSMGAGFDPQSGGAILWTNIVTDFFPGAITVEASQKRGFKDMLANLPEYTEQAQLDELRETVYTPAFDKLFEKLMVALRKEQDIYDEEGYRNNVYDALSIVYGILGFNGTDESAIQPYIDRLRERVENLYDAENTYDTVTPAFLMRAFEVYTRPYKARGDVDPTGGAMPVSEMLVDPITGAEYNPADNAKWVGDLTLEQFTQALKKGGFVETLDKEEKEYGEEDDEDEELSFEEDQDQNAARNNRSRLESRHKRMTQQVIKKYLKKRPRTNNLSDDDAHIVREMAEGPPMLVRQAVIEASRNTPDVRAAFKAAVARLFDLKLLYRDENNKPTLTTKGEMLERQLLDRLLNNKKVRVDLVAGYYKLIQQNTLHKSITAQITSQLHTMRQPTPPVEKYAAYATPIHAPASTKARKNPAKRAAKTKSKKKMTVRENPPGYVLSNAPRKRTVFNPVTQKVESLLTVEYRPKIHDPADPPAKGGRGKKRLVPRTKPFRPRVLLEVDTDGYPTTEVFMEEVSQPLHRKVQDVLNWNTDYEYVGDKERHKRPTNTYTDWEVIPAARGERSVRGTEGGFAKPAPLKRAKPKSGKPDGGDDDGGGPSGGGSPRPAAKPAPAKPSPAPSPAPAAPAAAPKSEAAPPEPSESPQPTSAPSTTKASDLLLAFYKDHVKKRVSADFDYTDESQIDAIVAGITPDLVEQYVYQPTGQRYPDSVRATMNEYAAKPPVFPATSANAKAFQREVFRNFARAWVALWDQNNTAPAVAVTDVDGKGQYSPPKKTPKQDTDETYEQYVARERNYAGNPDYDLVDVDVTLRFCAEGGATRDSKDSMNRTIAVKSVEMPAAEDARLQGSYADFKDAYTRAVEGSESCWNLTLSLDFIANCLVQMSTEMFKTTDDKLATAYLSGPCTKSNVKHIVMLDRQNRKPYVEYHRANKAGIASDETPCGRSLVSLLGHGKRANREFDLLEEIAEGKRRNGNLTAVTRDAILRLTPAQKQVFLRLVGLVKKFNAFSTEQVKNDPLGKVPAPAGINIKSLPALDNPFAVSSVEQPVPAPEPELEPEPEPVPAPVPAVPKRAAAPAAKPAAPAAPIDMEAFQSQQGIPRARGRRPTK
jgi:hypothetical protein